MKVIPVSYGQSAPIAENNNTKAEQKTRVEILVYREGITRRRPKLRRRSSQPRRARRRRPSRKVREPYSADFFERLTGQRKKAESSTPPFYMDSGFSSGFRG